jgi:hypothetical protein
MDGLLHAWPACPQAVIQPTAGMLPRNCLVQWHHQQGRALHRLHRLHTRSMLQQRQNMPPLDGLLQRVQENNAGLEELGTLIPFRCIALAAKCSGSTPQLKSCAVCGQDTRHCGGPPEASICSAPSSIPLHLHLSRIWELHALCW